MNEVVSHAVGYWGEHWMNEVVSRAVGSYLSLNSITSCHHFPGKQISNFVKLNKFLLRLKYCKEGNIREGFIFAIFAIWWWNANSTPRESLLKI